VSPRKKADDEQCPKCGCPELTTTGRDRRGGGFVIVTSCPACHHIVRPEPGSIEARAREVTRKHAVKLATKAVIVDELATLVRGFGAVESIDLAVLAPALMNLAILAAHAEGVTREGLLEIFATAVARKYDA
jgi:hypothetical protein